MAAMNSPTRRRNHVIDLARAASVLVVVVFHGLLFQIRIEDGRPVVTPWAAPHWLWPLTWVLMVMPLFFVAGGFAHALTVDRMRREGEGYAHYLVSRGRRLVGPAVLFVTVCALLATVAAWAGWLDVAADFSRQLMQLFWFITVYLTIVAVAPLMVDLHDRFGVVPMLGLAVMAAAVDAWSFAVDDDNLRNLNRLLVWPLVHQLGIAYERGWFRTGASWRAWAPVGAGAAGVGLLVRVAGYPGSAVGFADIPIANIQPPTLAMASLALAQCGALALVERSGALAMLPRRLARLLDVANALMVSIYLWHIPCIFLAGGHLVLLAWAVPPMAGDALFHLTVGVLGLVLVAALVPLVGRLELRLIPPMGRTQNAALGIAAYGVLMVGALLVWRAGTVVHPAQPVSSLGVGAIWAGSWLMARAADTRAHAVTAE